MAGGFFFGGVSGDSHEFGIRPAYSHGVYTRPYRVPSPHFLVTSPTVLTGDSKGSCSVMLAIEEPTQNMEDPDMPRLQSPDCRTKVALKQGKSRA